MSSVKPLSKTDHVDESPSYVHIQKILSPIWSIVSRSLFTAPVKEIVSKKESKKEKLIQEHSQLLSEASKNFRSLEATLDSSFFTKEDRKKLAALLGQFLGARIIRGSPLEQIPPYVGTHLMNGFLNEWSSCSESKGKIEALLKIFKQLSATAQEIHEFPTD